MTVIENPQGSKLPERMIERRAIEAVNKVPSYLSE